MENFSGKHYILYAIFPIPRLLANLDRGQNRRPYQRGLGGGREKIIPQYQGQQGLQNQLTARDFYDTIHLEQDNDIRWLGSVDVPGRRLRF